MKRDKKIPYLAILFVVVGMLLVAIGVNTQTWVLLPSGALFGFLALVVAFRSGKQEGRGIVVDEDLIPVEIYQMIAVTMDGSFPVAILRNNKKERIACKSLSMEGFAHFSVIGGGNERFFVPKSPKQSETAGSPVVDKEYLANSHGGVG